MAIATSSSGTSSRTEKGPIRKQHGKISIIPLDEAIAWTERFLQRRRLTAPRRRSIEDGLTRMRVDRAFIRAAQAQRRTRQNWTYRRQTATEEATP